MDLAQVATIVRWMIGSWLAFVFIFVLTLILSGKIILAGLFRTDPKAPFGIDRMQLGFVTLLFAAGYLVASLARGPGEGLPEVPTPILLVLIGSNGAYLAVKYAALIGGPKRGR
jgi:hypothetical protein